MAIDQNIYALSISLDLDAAVAFQTLDRFEESLTSVERSIADAASKSLGQIDNMVKQIELNISGLTSSLNSMGIQSDSLAKAMDYAGVSVDDLGGSVDEQIKNLKKARDFWQEISDINKDVADFAQDELDASTEYVKSLEKIIKTITKKNVGHKKEVDLVGSEIPLFEQLAGQANNLAGSTDEAGNRLDVMFRSMTKIVDLLMVFDRETDNFTEANYRLVGSQQEILNMTRHLSAETGIYRAESIQAYKALADIKYPLEQMDKMAEQVGKLNIITGVGIGTIVQYSHAMRQTGIDADGTIMQLNRMAAAQRALGLSTYDTNRIMQDAAMSTASQIAMFGKDAPEAFQKAAMGLAAVGKETGMAVQQQQEWMKTMQLSGVEAELFWGEFGNLSEAEMQDVNARYNAMGTAVANFAKEANMSLEKLAYGAKNDNEAIALKELADAYGVTVEQMTAMAQAQIDLTAEQKAGLLTMEGVSKTLEDEIARNRMWAETLQTLSRQWDILKAKISGVIGPFMQMAADSLIVLVEALNWVIGAVETLITWGRELITWLESTIPGFSMVTTVAKFAAGAFITFAGAILLIGGLGGMLGRFFGMAASGIEAIGSAIGGALANLGNAVRSVMLPLLALGAAFLMVGAGAYLFALSVSTIAQEGWAAVPALFGMIVAVGLLGAVLVGLAMLAQGPVALGLLAVSIALLAVGSTVWMIGAGFKMMAEAANILALAIIQLTASGAIGEFATQLLSASWKVLLAAPMLAFAAVILIPAAIALGAAGLVLAGSAVIFAFAAVTIGMAATMLGSGLKSLAEGVGLASEVDFVTMAKNLLYGSAMLVWVGPLILAGAILLLPAGMALFTAGLALWAGAYGINRSAELLAAVGDKLIVAGVKIRQAAAPLLDGLTAIIPAAFASLIAGPALLAGAMAIIPGAVILSSAGFLISTGSGYLYDGAILFSGAVNTIAESSMKLFDVAGDILFGASSLAIGAGILMAGSATLFSSAGLLAITGVMLLPAAISLYAGMFWLSGAITRLNKIAPDLHAISNSMWALATSFIIMGSTNFGILTNLAESGLAAIPAINIFATELGLAADKLSISVDKLSDPALRLSNILGSIQTSINSLDLQGLTLESDVSQMGQELEKYATALEAAAIRVETAISAKALPAIDEANASGISDIVKSEAITTVKVLDQRDGGVRNAEQDAQQQQVVLLTKIMELVSTLVSPENKNAASAILELLEEYLPEFSDNGSGLNNSSMSKWTN